MRFKVFRYLAVLLASSLGLFVGALQPASAAPSAAAAATQIQLSPTSGPVGTSVTVTGTGFRASTTGTVIIGSSTVQFLTTSAGAFTTTAVVPTAPLGALTFTAKTANIKASAAFTVTAPEPAPQPPISNSRLRFGVATNGGAQATSELNEVAALAGESPSLVLYYKDFAQPAPIADLESVRARGATSIVTWEPWTWGGDPVNQPAYSLDRLAAGDYDPYLIQWGQSLRDWGHPVMLRLAHEMNGNWYPWAEGVNGNSAGDYVAAWRHVHDVVAGTGATNVQWVWAPNVPYWGSTPLSGLYPGSAYVDAVGLDGYNWGTSASWSSWISPQDLFGQGLAELRALAPGMPIIITETASSEAGGSKAAWNSSLISYLYAQPDVTGFVWFHLNKEVDWRINSSQSSADAFAAALLARRS
jgi:beta-mannanase